MTARCPPLQRPLSPLVNERFQVDRVNCFDIEILINREIARSIPEHLKLDWHEDKLREAGQRSCHYCRGYGCQYCLGRGRMMW
jgi:hypothetical protein